MNTAPTNPHYGTAPPTNVLVPPGGQPQIYVQDPSDQAPDDEVDPIPIISDQLAPGVLASLYNVRASFRVGQLSPLTNHRIYSSSPVHLPTTNLLTL